MNLALERLEWDAAVSAGMSKLRNLIIDLIARGEEEQRVVTAADHYRTGLAHLEVFLADQPAMLAWRHPDADRVLIVHMCSIGSDVHPAGVGILHDDQVGGADIASAVELVQEGNGEFVKIDGFVSIDIHEQG